MSPFHGHTPTSATAFDSAAPVGGDPAAAMVHVEKSRVGGGGGYEMARLSPHPPTHPTNDNDDDDDAAAAA